LNLLSRELREMPRSCEMVIKNWIIGHIAFTPMNQAAGWSYMPGWSDTKRAKLGRDRCYGERNMCLKIYLRVWWSKHTQSIKEKIHHRFIPRYEKRWEVYIHHPFTPMRFWDLTALMKGLAKIQWKTIIYRTFRAVRNEWKCQIDACAFECMLYVTFDSRVTNQSRSW
jgi:hypothetical protein